MIKQFKQGEVYAYHDKVGTVIHIVLKKEESKADKPYKHLLIGFKRVSQTLAHLGHITHLHDHVSQIA